MQILVDKIAENLVDMIFPPRCAVCNDIIYHKREGICSDCANKLKYVTEPYCYKCGKPLEDDAAEYCKDCMSKPHYYEEGRGLLVYDEYMSKSIYRFKYNHKKEYGAFYGKVINDRLGDKIKEWNAQCLIPVPVHKSKLKTRGYNQAQVLAKELSKHCKIPVRSDLMLRNKSTVVQKKLSATDRENNLKKAFIVSKNVVSLNSVIIVDDIYTTGSTVDAMAKCLKEAGVRDVYFITLCIGRGF